MDNKKDKDDNIVGIQKLEKKRKLYIGIARIVIIFVILLAISCILSKFKLGKFLPDFSKSANDFVKENVIGKEGDVTTITESSIKDVFEINELQTVDYIYNAIARAYDSDGKTLKYYVTYNGKITAGIDFSSVDINIIEEQKIIKISVPDVTIQDTVVDAGTLEFIFEKKKYNKESIYQEAYGICQSDLDKKASTEPKLLNMARDNAKQVIEALITPWVEQIDSDYTVTIE